MLVETSNWAKLKKQLGQDDAHPQFWRFLKRERMTIKLRDLGMDSRCYLRYIS